MHDSWEPDPLIMDDQCAIINVRDKGLVIITGCGHSGIINTIRNAQIITGIHKIYAVIGSFHLTGALFELIIHATIATLLKGNQTPLCDARTLYGLGCYPSDCPGYAGGLHP